LTRRESFKLAGAGAAALLAVRAGGRQVLAQASSSTDLTSLGLPELDLTITDSSYEGLSSELAAGLYLVKLTNNAANPAFIVFMQLPEGMKAADLTAMLGGGGATPEDGAASPEATSGSSGPPDWYYTTYLAGGAGIGPGASATFVFNLQPGNYVVWGEDPSATQQPLDLTVTGGAGSPATSASPQAEVTIQEQATESGFAFGIGNSFVPGSQVVEIDNVSDVPHFVEIDHVPDGTTLDDVMNLLQSEMSGTPTSGGLSEADIQPIYFVGTQSGNTTQWHDISFDAGTYVLSCWVPDINKGGIPHAMEGMVNLFVVGGPGTPTS
jgi:hypothetical protein